MLVWEVFHELEKTACFGRVLELGLWADVAASSAPAVFAPNGLKSAGPPQTARSLAPAIASTTLSSRRRKEPEPPSEPEPRFEIPCPV